MEPLCKVLIKTIYRWLRLTKSVNTFLQRDEAFLSAPRWISTSRVNYWLHRFGRGKERSALHNELYKHNNALFFPKYFGYLNNPTLAPTVCCCGTASAPQLLARQPSEPSLVAPPVPDTHQSCGLDLFLRITWTFSLVLWSPRVYGGLARGI